MYRRISSPISKPTSHSTSNIDNTQSIELHQITTNIEIPKEDQLQNKQYTNINEYQTITETEIKENNARQPIVRLRNIHKTYLLGLEGVPALRGISLTINSGEFIIILGKSGGGKTSMLNIMGTIDIPTKGDLYLCGQRICNKTTDSQVSDLRLKNIGFCFQTFNLISSMTALENVELPMILDGRLSSKKIRERAIALLTHVGLEDRYKHLPSQLSGGEQQRVTISRAIANKPKLLLLDEPTGDLDTLNSNIIIDLLLKLNREKQITCVFVTHDVSLKYYAHRVIHMLDGRISKIEIIPDKYRRQMEEQLQRELNEAQNMKILDKSSMIKTEYRNPESFYGYLKFKKSFDLEMKSREHLKKMFDEDGNEIIVIDEYKHVISDESILNAMEVEIEEEEKMDMNSEVRNSASFEENKESVVNRDEMKAESQLSDDDDDEEVPTN